MDNKDAGIALAYYRFCFLVASRLPVMLLVEVGSCLGDFLQRCSGSVVEGRIKALSIDPCKSILYTVLLS
jgi:hypothetical protein